jgi:putative ABC transport system ATP-binding protein
MQVVVAAATMILGGRTIFKSLDAVFPSNAVTALVGPSGSGKSTLLAAIAGYQRLTEGTVRYSFADGSSQEPDPNAIAWVPQGSNALGTRSALDNVAVAALSEGRTLPDAHDAALEALRTVGLADIASQPARSLSGGELQRVGFARALASTRPIVLADEPSASLDADNTRRIAELLTALHQRATIIVATHDPILVDAAEHTVMLRTEHADAA